MCVCGSGIPYVIVTKCPHKDVNIENVGVGKGKGIKVESPCKAWTHGNMYVCIDPLTIFWRQKLYAKSDLKITKPPFEDILICRNEEKW